MEIKIMKKFKKDEDDDLRINFKDMKIKVKIPKLCKK